MRILLVEDDEVIAAQVAEVLARDRFTVEVRHDGESGLDAAILGNFGLVILDVMLPGMDGWQICRELRQGQFTVPVLMLTARDAIDDRVRGFEEGADDYLPKPFDIRELQARVRALVRRETVNRTGKIQIADLEIDTQSHVVRRAGKEVHLTPREFSLLEALARNQGRTLTRDAILERVWDREENTENTVNFHVTSLRKKVDAPFETKLIHTVHGFGYVLRSPEGS